MVLFIEETKELALGKILPNRIQISEYLQHVYLYLLARHQADNYCMDDFLYKNGRQEQVGMYLRDQTLRNPTFRSVYKNRGDSERTHNNIKSAVKFDVRKLGNSSKKLYFLAHFGGISDSLPLGINRIMFDRSSNSPVLVKISDISPHGCDPLSGCHFFR